MTGLFKRDIEINEENNEEIEKHSILIGYYNYTVVLTYIGMLVSFAGILFATKNNIKYALLCLVISGFCDMFDGAIASTRKRTKKEKRFGVQIDSLSDLICFGVFPAIIVNFHINNKFTAWICGLYVLCALIRLAYFNVDEEERQDKVGGKRKYYKGMPVTMMAIILPLACMFLPKPGSLFVLLAASFAFLVPVKLRKAGNVGKVVMFAIGLFTFITVLMEVL